ncbi:MAG TPA: globin domain-containing protein [Acidimicrobiales bacterium]|jgi:hemoglobin-like flavoprotein|nr:globin domain-containing protein [Acidimicrobiales bacterium]
MTPEQIRLVEAVIAQIGEHPEYAGRFYERLFAAAPQTAGMFPDVQAQQQKLTDELTAMVALLNDLGSLEERAQELGARHRGYGVRAGHYRLAREAMADTLRDVLGDEFGPDQEAAWNRATSLITELMMSA